MSNSLTEELLVRQLENQASLGRCFTLLGKGKVWVVRFL